MGGIRSLAAACIAIALDSSPAHAQFRGCAVDDYPCFDDLMSQYCVEPQATTDSCRSLAADLQAQWGVTPTVAIGTSLGGIYFILSDNANVAGDDADETLNLTRARQVLSEVIASDQAASKAYEWLAIVDYDSIAVRADWLRRLVALEASFSNVGKLISALTEARTPAGYLESVDIARAAYAREASGTEKWALAHIILGIYQSASMHAPGTFEPDSGERLVSRVRNDSNWARITSALADPARDPTAMRNALETACRLIGIFGEEVCMRGIDSTVQAALRDSSSPDAQILADAAAYGAIATPPDGNIATPDTRMPRLSSWIDELVAGGLDSLVVLDAVATRSNDLDRRFETRLEIVARNPNSGRARLDLAIQHFNRDEWEAARSQFESARALLPADDRFQTLARQYLRIIEYEIGREN